MVQANPCIDPEKSTPIIKTKEEGIGIVKKAKKQERITAVVMQITNP